VNKPGNDMLKLGWFRGRLGPWHLHKHRALGVCSVDDDDDDDDDDGCGL
jgi:hypothetical protein